MPADSAVKNVIRLAKFWLLVLTCMAVIFYFSSLPAKDIPAIFPLQDVLFHAIIYAVLGYLFAQAVKNTDARIRAAKLILYTVVFGILYGTSDEFHQLFVAGRDASLFDLFLDTAGSFIGSAIYR